jgi:hypothetical protein
MSENQEVVFSKVPFTLDEMKDYFVNRNKFFIVSYKNSELKGNRFLSYLANLEIPFEIDISDCSNEEKSELILEFMKSRNIVKISSLSLMVAEIILVARGSKGVLLSNGSFFTEVEKIEFAQKHKELIHTWITFISSTSIYMLTTLKAVDEVYNFKQGYKEVLDAHYLGQNVIQLFSVPAFMEIYFSLPQDVEMFYFKHQFEDYMFKGQSLYYYFNTTENIPFVIFQGLMSGDILPSDLNTLRDSI